MKRNFSLDQRNVISNHNLNIDTDIKDGLCAGMVLEWLRREVLDQRQSGVRYRDATAFSPRQRSFDMHYETKDKLPLALKSDRYTSTFIAESDSKLLSYHLRSVRSGVFCLGLFPYSCESDAHMIGLSIDEDYGRYRLFDPNHGEFETVNTHIPNMALQKCQKYISTNYPFARYPRMQVYELKKK